MDGTLRSLGFARIWEGLRARILGRVLARVWGRVRARRAAVYCLDWLDHGHDAVPGDVHNEHPVVLSHLGLVSVENRVKCYLTLVAERCPVK